MKQDVHRIMIRLLLAMGMLLIGLRANTFLRMLHQNLGESALIAYAAAESHCSQSAQQKLEVVKANLVQEKENGGRYLQTTRVDGRLEYFQTLCEEMPPLEKGCLSSREAARLSFERPERLAVDESGWKLIAYWVDRAAIEFGTPTTIVLKWRASNENSLNWMMQMKEYTVLEREDDSGRPWCLSRQGSVVYQSAKLANMVPDGGFEWSFLAQASPPSGYKTNIPANQGAFYYSLMEQDSPASIAGCLRADREIFPDFGPSLYVWIPVEGEGEMFLLGALARSEGAARISIGGSWELAEERTPELIVVNEETGGRWNSYAGLIASPPGTSQYTFRVANWGDKGIACFDSVFVLPLSYPARLKA